MQLLIWLVSRFKRELSVNPMSFLKFRSLANLALEINFDLSGARNEFVLRKINKMHFWQYMKSIILYLSPRQHPFLMVSFSSPYLSTIIEL